MAKNTLAEFEQFSFESIPNEKVTSTLEKIVDRMDLFKPESIPSVVPKLLGMYGEALPSAPYILEHLVNNYEVLDVETRYFLTFFRMSKFSRLFCLQDVFTYRNYPPLSEATWGVPVDARTTFPALLK